MSHLLCSTNLGTEGRSTGVCPLSLLATQQLLKRSLLPVQDGAEDAESETTDVPKSDPPQLNGEPTDLGSGAAEDTAEDEDAVEPAKGMPLSPSSLPRPPESLFQHQRFKPTLDGSFVSQPQLGLACSGVINNESHTHAATRLKAPALRIPVFASWLRSPLLRFVFWRYYDSSPTPNIP